MTVVEVEYIVSSLEDYLFWEKKVERQGKRVHLLLKHPKAEGTKDNDHHSSMPYKITLENPKDEYALGDTLKLCLFR